MLSYTEIKPGKIIALDGDPCEIVWTSGVVKKQRQKPHNTAKLKNLKSGAVIEKVFTQADKIEEAELDTREVRYLYSHRGEHWFADPDNPKERFCLPEEKVEGKILHIRENDTVDVVVYDDEIIMIKLPIKVTLRVSEAPPNIKGNTAQGGTKVCILETGLKVTTPLFIEKGDSIVINTDTGEYIERAKQV